MKRVLVLGATSAIAEQTARIFAQRGDSLMLVARNRDRLAAMSEDLKVRGAATCELSVTDLTDYASHKEMIHNTYEKLGGLDIVLVAYGTLGNQQACEQDFAVAMMELQTNFTTVVSLLTLLANRFEQQRQGSIAVISSVAGDRGRQSNYVYGAAKGALTIYLQGLRNRLARADVQVLTIKPGFVDTPMTREFNKGLLWVGPEVIARGIVRAIDRNRDVVYLPFFWRYIMFIIKMIPERIFKRMSL